MKNWLIAGGAVVGLALVLFLSDRPVQTPSGIDLIRNPNQNIDANNKVALLVVDVWRRADDGGTITEEDKGKLKQGAQILEAMRTYYPPSINSNFGAGKCYMLLGEKERASERFEQAIMNKNVDKDRDIPDVKLTVFECMALLSEVTVDLAAEEIANYNSLSQASDKVGAENAKKKSQIYFDKALDYSNQAVLGVPDAPRYLIDRATVYLALKKNDLAKKDIVKAKQIAPTDRRVTMMTKLVGL